MPVQSSMDFLTKALRLGKQEKAVPARLRMTFYAYTPRPGE